MTTIKGYIDGVPRLFLDKMLQQCKEKLGGEIEFTVTEKNVVFTKIPSNYKNNIFENITNIGFFPSLE